MFGFSFLHPAVLYGLLAVTLPVLIHLLFKAKTQRVVFSSVQFILASVVRKRRRLRLKELILLLLRAAIIVCLVLAFARPFLRRGPAAQLGQVAGENLVILLDDTCSMRFEKQGKTLFQRARDAARSQIKKAGWRTRVAVLSFSGTQAADGFFPSRKAALSAVEKMQPTLLASAAADVLARGEELIRTQCTGRTHVVVISDFQESTWQSAEGSSLATWFPAGVDIELVDVGASGLTNLAITGIPAAVPFPGGTQVYVRVENFGATARKVVPVRCSVDGKPVAEREVDLSAGEIKDILFTLPARVSGLPVVFKLHARDDFPADDIRFGVLRRGEPLRVLLVEESPPAESFRRVGFFLATALNPWRDSDRVSQPIIAEIVGTDDLTEKMISQTDVIVLTAAGDLSTKTVLAIEKAIRGGAGLVLFGAENFTPQVWRRFFSVRKDDRPSIRRGIKGESWRIATVDETHPIFDKLPASLIEQLKSVAFNGYVVAPAPKSAKVLAWFDNGDPAMVERKDGKGKVLFFASSADDAWTDFPKHTCYVPLMHRIVTDVARKKAKLAVESVVVGQPVPSGWLEDAFTLIRPDGEKVDLNGETRVCPMQVGLYGVVRSDGSKRWFAANIDPKECDPHRLTEKTIRLLERGDATVRKIVEDADLLQRRRERGAAPPGFERTLFALALVLMVVELAVANRMRV